MATDVLKRPRGCPRTGFQFT